MNTNDASVCEVECLLLRDLPYTYSFAIERGSVHAVFSDNPQVSINLLRCIAGHDQPMGGAIRFETKWYEGLNPKQAAKLGIEIIDHRKKTFPDLTVLDNIYCERRRSGTTHQKSRNLIKQQMYALFEELAIEINPRARLKTLTTAQRKLVEVVRSILASPKLLCMEDSVLRDIEEHTIPGIRDVIRMVLLRMVNNGLTLVIASNDMNEIASYANRVSIFKRDGDSNTINVAQVDKYQLMQMAYGFITSRTALAQDNFELYYYKQMYQEIINSLIFPVVATDTHHNIIIYNQEVKKVYFEKYDDLIGKPIQTVLGLSEALVSDLEKELLFLPGTRVFRLPEIFVDTRIYVSPITDNMGSYMGMLYVFSKEEDREGVFNSYLHKPTDIEFEYKINELIHEVKNPLGIMLNYLSLIQKETSLITIKKETECIAKEISRINRLLGKLKKKKEPENAVASQAILVQTIVQEINDFLRPTLESKHIVLETAFPDGFMVKADGDALRQVFLNLMLNAIEAITDGGVIRLSGAVESVDDGYASVIRIADNGCGIPSDALSSIFNPFFTTKTDVNSHGIGLSITREIVERLGGRIDVKSEFGHGATFTIFL